jgi:lipoprotein-anchoring transpeptidase ErfK/SrfK
MPARLTGCTVLVLLAVAVAAPAADARRPSFVHAKQELAVLLSAHRAVSSLRAHPATTTTVSASRPITGGPTVLPVIDHATKNGVIWLRVLLPGRPNGRKGWIREHGTRSDSTSWHVLVRTSSRRVRVYRRGRLVRTFTAIVGKPSTPTPRGRFFVEESVRMPAGSAGGPYALASSARSNVLQEFEGGPGQIALHGVENLGGTFGTASSHGCVRLTNQAITWLVARVGPGAPITITL